MVIETYVYWNKTSNIIPFPCFGGFITIRCSSHIVNQERSRATYLHGARVTCPPLTNIWADQHTLLFERTHTWLSIHSTDRPGLAHIPQDDAQQLGDLRIGMRRIRGR